VASIDVRPKGQSENERVIGWRREQLEHAGYSPQFARRLARRMTVDLHVAKELLQNGCKPEIALRILL
jgi:hypothetical protein